MDSEIQSALNITHLDDRRVGMLFPLGGIQLMMNHPGSVAGLLSKRTVYTLRRKKNMLAWHGTGIKSQLFDLIDIHTTTFTSQTSTRHAVPGIQQR